jgi:type IV fimbrial biogenesis protein FimT
MTAISRNAHSGFTLFELMVVVAVVLVIALLAVPSFARLVEATRIRTEATRLMSDIVLARSEAIKRNRQVSLCPARIDAAGQRQCGGLLAGGWVIFEDSDRDGILDAGENIIRIGRGMASSLGVSNRLATRDATAAISYRSDGSSRRNLTLMVCSREQPALVSWSVVMNLVGRPRMARDWGKCVWR